jgi:hypothetical protein
MEGHEYQPVLIDQFFNWSHRRPCHDIDQQRSHNFSLLLRFTHRLDRNFDRLLEFGDNLPAVHHGLLLDGSSLPASWAA